jgi:hypothetical protein
VVFPDSGDAEVALGGAFVAEGEAFDQCDRGGVPRDDVGFDAVEGEGAEGEVDGEGECFAHVTLAGVGGTDPVSEGCGLEGTADDVVETDLADDSARVGERDEMADAGLGVARAVETIECLVIDGALVVGEERLPGFEPCGGVLAEAEVRGFVASCGESEADAGLGRILLEKSRG